MCSRSDCRYGAYSPPFSTPSSHSSPIHRRSSRMACSDSRVDRSVSVSSIRRTNVPPDPRASSQLNNAVRALPTCSCPVGLGAKRTRIVRGSGVIFGGHSKSADESFRVSSKNDSRPPHKRYRMRRDRIAGTHRIYSFVRLALHAYLLYRNVHSLRKVSAHLIAV